jgi:tryptophan halogenase
VAISRGIKVFDDVIKEVSQNDNGNISKLIGQEANYTYDFYIDCTGFRRVLIGKLGSKWISHSKYLKMKSAMVFPTKDTESIPLWITARAMDYGWFFKTPIYNRYGNGYIYDSDYVSSDDAKLEIDRLMGYEVEIAQHIKFDPGCLDKVWIKNCCAIGLSGSFVEPLEASSIGSTIHQTFLLMHRLENYSQRTIDSYNVSFHSIIENIRDYIIIHYLTKKTNTEFWQDCARIELPESLGNKLALWKEHLPIQEDLSLSSNYILYNDQNHILILAGLDYFNRESILQEYKSCSYRLHYEVDQILKTRHFHDQTDKSVSHRQFIERIRKVSLQ